MSSSICPVCTHVNHDGHDCGVLEGNSYCVCSRIIQQTTIKDLQDLVVHWANEVFPDRKPHETLAKLVLEEIPELAKTPTEDEFADVMILVLDLGYLYGIDLEKAVINKMRVNRARSWKKDPKVGYWHHV